MRIDALSIVLAGLAVAAVAHAQNAPVQVRPLARPSVRHDRSTDLRAMPPVAPTLPSQLEMPPPRLLPKTQHAPAPAIPYRYPAPQQRLAFPPLAGAQPTQIANFEGIRRRDPVLPPDTNGDIGPNHYVQIVNLSFAVFDRSGNLLFGPVSTNTLWQGFGGVCEQYNSGDPIVLYDQFADRWLVSQFAVFTNQGFHQCIAISQTGDPAGAYYRYDFFISDTKMNDYPKFGIWPDGYYMAVNQYFSGTFEGAGQGVAAFERDKMLQGLEAQMVFVDLYDTNPMFGGMLPSDLDGVVPPPPGAPNYFVEVDSADWGWASDRLQVFKFHVDWNNTALSTFTGPRVVDLTAAGLGFDPNLCGYSRNCIPQPGGSRLDAISDRLMYRLAYRNFGDHESLVVNHTVDVDGTDHAGVRWYELRDPGGTPPTLYQTGTFAPDSDHRWMGSAAMDHQGNIALGYSVSSTSTYPSIRYTGRLATDPLGVMSASETTLIAGGGSQSHSSGRWGDYSMMSVDPLDDCTFWYTQEYYAANSLADWQTRIGSFRFPNCIPPGGGVLQGTVTDTTATPLAGVKLQAGAFTTFTDETGHFALSMPAASFTVTATKFGYFTQTESVAVTVGGTTVQDFTLAVRPKVIFQGTVHDGSGHGWPLYARVVLGGGITHTVFTNPFSGEFSLELPEGESIRLDISPIVGGYNKASPTVTATAGATEEFPLGIVCSMDYGTRAPGYDSESCEPLPGGLIAGNVFDANTGLGLNGVSISYIGVRSFATQDDPAVADGFYYTSSPPGTQSVTASKSGYVSDTHSVEVVADAVVKQDFSLASGLLHVSPLSLELTVDQGSVAQRTLTLENVGSADVTFQAVPRGVSIAGSASPPPRDGDQEEAGSPANAKSLPPGRPHRPAPAVTRKGTVLTSWVADVPSWGIAVSDSDRVWVGSPAANWGGNNQIYEFTPDGRQTGRSYAYNWGAPNGPADGAFNWNTGRIWQMDVGQDDCIHEIDQTSGVTGNRICPGLSVSQRGLAYDPESDTWLIGGWNDGVIYRVDHAGVILEAADVGLSISGLAYNPDTHHLFVVENWGDPYELTVIVLDATANFSVVGAWGYGVDSAGAGLEMGCDGTLWAVDQGTNTVYHLDTGEATSVCASATVDWLTVMPDQGTVTPGATQPLHLDFNTHLPGTFKANLRITNDGPAGSVDVPVTLNVLPSPDAPVAVADSYVTDVGLGAVVTITAPGVLANDTDPNGDSLTAHLVTAPKRGTLQLQSDGSFTYTPQSPLVDSDSFTYRADNGAYGSNEASVTLQYLHPVPVLESISPASVSVFESRIVLLTGTGFSSATEVRWNGAPRSSTVISPNQMQIEIGLFELLNAGMVEITIFNPAPGGGPSNSLYLTVANPVPRIASLNPMVVVPGGGDLTLSVNSADGDICYDYGEGDIECLPTFTESSVVRWNGSERPTVMSGLGSNLQATIPAADVAAAGSAQVTVFTPAPGGGTSNAVRFDIVPRPANDNFANATAVTQFPFTDRVDTRTATNEPADLPWMGLATQGGCLTIGGIGIDPDTKATNTVWYKFTPSTDTRLKVNLLGTDYHAVMAVLTGEPGPLTRSNCVQSTWDLRYSEFVFLATARTTYYFVVGTYPSGGSSGGNLVFNLSGTDYSWLDVIPSARGTVTSEPAGLACGTLCSAGFVSGTEVALTATANPGYRFVGWGGACSGASKCVLTLGASEQVSAFFVPETEIALLVSGGGAGSGSVVARDNSNNLTGYCRSVDRYSQGCVFSSSPGAARYLFAYPDNVYSALTEWRGACTGPGQCAVTMDTDKSVSAIFSSSLDSELTVQRSGGGAGYVVSDPWGIDCGATCSGVFWTNTLVTLTAVAKGDSVFTGWTGACSGTGACSLLVNAPKAVTANFSPPGTQLFTLAVSRAGSGAGIVTSTSAGIDCGLVCSAMYEPGSVVTLTSSAAAGSEFAGWSGACSGTGACSLTMDNAKNVIATFNLVAQQQQYTLTFNKAGFGRGTVTSTPSGIDCGIDCGSVGGPFGQGSVVNLTASPASGSYFNGWSEACTGTGGCSVTMDSDKLVIGRFDPVPPGQFALTVSLTGGGAGTVTSDPAGIVCGTTCSAPFTAGTVVTLTAAPGAGATFAGWSGDCTGTGVCIVTVSANRDVSATFYPPPDFVLGPPPPPQRITAGSPAQFAVSLNGANGFAGIVTFTCTSGVPSGAWCSFSPATVNLAAGAGSTTLTITTTGTHASLFWPGTAAPGYAGMLPVAGLIVATCRRRSRKRNRMPIAISFLLILLLALMWVAGCGGGGGGSSSPPPRMGTPPGNYTVTFTATGGNLTHTQTVNLIVN